VRTRLCGHHNGAGGYCFEGVAQRRLFELKLTIVLHIVVSVTPLKRPSGAATLERPERREPWWSAILPLLSADENFRMAVTQDVSVCRRPEARLLIIPRINLGPGHHNECL
jgi:hypothetical protein